MTDPKLHSVASVVLTWGLVFNWLQVLDVVKVQDLEHLSGLVVDFDGWDIQLWELETNKLLG